jgi:hypothetical protein
MPSSEHALVFALNLLVGMHKPPILRMERSVFDAFERTATLFQFNLVLEKALAVRAENGAFVTGAGKDES